jgi:hypothetical protein
VDGITSAVQRKLLGVIIMQSPAIWRQKLSYSCWPDSELCMIISPREPDGRRDRALQPSNVRFGSLAAATVDGDRVRFTPESCRGAR